MVWFLYYNACLTTLLGPIRFRNEFATLEILENTTYIIIGIILQFILELISERNQHVLWWNSFAVKFVCSIRITSVDFAHSQPGSINDRVHLDYDCVIWWIKLMVSSCQHLQLQGHPIVCLHE